LVVVRWVRMIHVDFEFEVSFWLVIYLPRWKYLVSISEACIRFSFIRIMVVESDFFGVREFGEVAYIPVNPCIGTRPNLGVGLELYDSGSFKLPPRFFQPAEARLLAALANNLLP
jgi:hypothetical protein